MRVFDCVIEVVFSHRGCNKLARRNGEFKEDKTTGIGGTPQRRPYRAIGFAIWLLRLGAVAAADRSAVIGRARDIRRSLLP